MKGKITFLNYSTFEAEGETAEEIFEKCKQEYMNTTIVPSERDEYERYEYDMDTATVLEQFTSEILNEVGLWT